MLVLVADQFESSGLDGLKQAGCDVVYDPQLGDETLVAALKHSQADVLVVARRR
jgi:D-3-phosphoglycerate dehydrogenase